MDKRKIDTTVYKMLDANFRLCLQQSEGWPKLCEAYYKMLPPSLNGYTLEPQCRLEEFPDGVLYQFYCIINIPLVEKSVRVGRILYEKDILAATDIAEGTAKFMAEEMVYRLSLVV